MSFDLVHLRFEPESRTCLLLYCIRDGGAACRKNGLCVIQNVHASFGRWWRPFNLL